MTFGNSIKINGRINLIPAAGDVSSPQNGDIWYNSSVNKFRKQENGVTSDMDTGGTLTTGKILVLSKKQFIP